MYIACIIYSETQLQITLMLLKRFKPILKVFRIVISLDIIETL